MPHDRTLRTQAAPRFRVADAEQVLGRIVDGEVIIIDFTTGIYFSLTGAGAEIWPLLEQGSTLDALTDHLAQGRDVAAETVRSDLVRLFDEMLAADLLRRDDDGSVSQETGWQEAAISTDVPRPAYVPPALQRFDDLADAFAIDPPLTIGRT